MSKLLVLLKTYGKLYIGAFNRKKNKGELIIGITIFNPMNYHDDAGFIAGIFCLLAV